MSKSKQIDKCSTVKKQDLILIEDEFQVDSDEMNASAMSKDCEIIKPKRSINDFMRKNKLKEKNVFKK